MRGAAWRLDVKVVGVATRRGRGAQGGVRGGGAGFDGLRLPRPGAYFVIVFAI